MGSIEQITTGRGRKYVYTDDEGVETTVPSVTTVLGSLPKGGLEFWGFKLGVAAVQELAGRLTHAEIVGGDLEDLYTAAKATDHAPHRALKKAGNRGTAVHEVAETLLLHGRLDEMPAGAADNGYVDALVKWHEDYDVADWEPVAIEARLVSLTHLYAGTADLIMRRPDGVYVVGDYKTSKSIYDSHLLQTAAYTHAAFEMGLIPDGAKVEQHVIRLAPDGTYEVQKSVHTIEDFAKVLAMHHLLKDKTKRGVKA